MNTKCTPRGLRLAWALTGLGTAAAVLLGPGVPVLAADEPYLCHWVVTTPREIEQQTGRNFANEIDFAGAPISKNAVIFYMHALGEFPYAGPHEYVQDPSWLGRHLAEIVKDVEMMIPDPGFSGLAVIDYERWNLLWERTNNQDHWREHINAHHPGLVAGLSSAEAEQVYKETYEAAAAEFYLATITTCREVRPSARWGFFNYPQKLYKSQNLVAKGTVGYGMYTALASQLNDTLDWLWEASDALYPVIYQPKVTLPLGVAPSDTVAENRYEDNVQFVETNVGEALRVGGGKPVFAFISGGYQVGEGAPTANSFGLNEINLDHSTLMPALCGASGLMLWSTLKDEPTAAAMQQWMTFQFAPKMIEVDLEVNGLPPDGGSDGGGDIPGTPDDPQGGSQDIPDAPKAPVADKKAKADEAAGKYMAKHPGITHEEALEALRRARKARQGSRGSTTGEVTEESSAGGGTVPRSSSTGTGSRPRPAPTRAGER
jgi:hypothetical protein